MKRPKRQIRIGISGWNYPGWRGNFYPKGLQQRRELEFASRQFNTIEINGSFYSLQTPKSYRAWYEQTPDDFVFAVKGSRFITHMKKLNDVEQPLANFLASGPLALKEKLGPILWQFPPMLKFKPERFESFLRLLPKTTSEAAELAREHDHRVGKDAVVETDQKRALRHAFEIRHDSFMQREFIELLRQYNVSFVFADTATRWPYLEDLTADFVYIRLHGDERLYESGYDDRSLDGWTERIRTWHEGGQCDDAKCVSEILPEGKPRDVYVYFDNDAKVHAPFDALALACRLTSFEPSLKGQKWREPESRRGKKPAAPAASRWLKREKRAA